MTCETCGEPCQGDYCKFCGKERHREGTWNPGQDTEAESDD